MRKTKKTLLLFLILLISLIFNFKDEVKATRVVTKDIFKSTEVTTNSKNIKPLTQTVRWFYRYRNGRLQKRLWSHTYGFWKTDWIWV